MSILCFLLCCSLVYLVSCNSQDNTTDARIGRQTFSNPSSRAGFFNNFPWQYGPDYYPLPAYSFRPQSLGLSPYYFVANLDTDELKMRYPPADDSQYVVLNDGRVVPAEIHHISSSDDGTSLPAAASSATFRQNLFGLSNINNQNNLFANLFSKVPNFVIRNPDASFPITNNYDSCTDSSGLSGTCVWPFMCTKAFGGKPSGSCGLGTVCCINTLAKCGGQMTINNTYWQSPSTLSSSSSCGLTVTLDNNLLEQQKKVCQVRLDFITFSIAQPNTETVCNVDTFQVGGASNRVPVICGDNNGQHMYLEAPSSVTDIQLLFTFGSSSSTSRLWNIKISLIPCGSNSLAPAGCLQYFTQSSGTISSFNWKDVYGTTTRQLANQDYRICFRTELVSGQAASKICFTSCTVTNGGSAFALSGDASGTSQSEVSDCNNDYLIIEAGYDPTVSSTSSTPEKNTWDRYCGTFLNPTLSATAAASVCTTVKSFSATYRTNGDETTSTTKDGSAIGNIGFCLSFQQSV